MSLQPLSGTEYENSGSVDSSDDSIDTLSVFDFDSAVSPIIIIIMCIQ